MEKKMSSKINPLPRLPLPALRDTCERYLSTVAPLLTNEEFVHTSALVQDFLSTQGPELQEELALLDSASNTGWLADLWREMYLEIRHPIALNVSIGYVTEFGPPGKRATQTRQAARLISSTLGFMRKVERKELEPDMQGNIPLCMSQYESLFSATRIPGIKIDEFVTFPRATHIVVALKNRFFRFELFRKDGKVLSEGKIEAGLNSIIEKARRAEKIAEYVPPVGLLTTEKRTRWAILRSLLSSYDACNKESFHVLDTALFVVCLDEATPAYLAETSRVMLHGDGKNRWFDKPLQWVICANGKTGMVMEHSAIDGITLVRYLSELHAQYGSPNGGGEMPHNSLPPEMAPVELQWNVPEEITKAIQRAETRIDRLISDTGIEVLEFEGFGREFGIKHKLSSDALVQMAIQMAYFRYHGDFVCTYEAVHTRKFQYGRTEAVRSVTPASIAMVEAFLSGADDKAKRAYLRHAINVHADHVRECMEGKGVDRHLFALRILARQIGKEHPMFEDKAYENILTRSVLSTSSLKSVPALRLFLFGPVVPEGYGIGYLINEDSMIFSVTSKQRGRRRFVDLLEKSLNDFKSLLEKGDKL